MTCWTLKKKFKSHFLLEDFCFAIFLNGKTQIAMEFTQPHEFVRIRYNYKKPWNKKQNQFSHKRLTELFFWTWFNIIQLSNYQKSIMILSDLFKSNTTISGLPWQNKMQEKSLVPSPTLQNLKIINDKKILKNMILLTSCLIKFSKDLA